MENPASALLHDFIFYLLKTEGIYKRGLCMPVFFFLQGGVYCNI